MKNNKKGDSAKRDNHKEMESCQNQKKDEEIKAVDYSQFEASTKSGRVGGSERNRTEIPGSRKREYDSAGRKLCSFRKKELYGQQLPSAQSAGRDGGLVAETICDMPAHAPLRRIDVEDVFTESGPLKAVKEKYGLTVEIVL